MFTHEQVRFGAEAVNDASQLNGNIACAHHGDALRQGRQLEEAVRVDAILNARNRRMARTAAGGDQDMIGGDRFAIHFHGFGIHKTGEAFDDINLVFA